MSEPAKGPPSAALIGVGVAAVAALAILAGLIIVAVVFLRLDNEATIQLDPNESGVASIALPPSNDDILVRFAADRASISKDFQESHSAFADDGMVTVTLDSCPFPRGCVLLLDLSDLPLGADEQSIEVRYPGEGSEYLDDILIEYRTDN